ncbi:MAG: hypothetical protein LBM38_05505 [Clostridiales bacterium]|nr:hypothetical protein [Clostridiales bacterium]
MSETKLTVESNNFDKEKREKILKMVNEFEPYACVIGCSPHETMQKIEDELGIMPSVIDMTEEFLAAERAKEHLLADAIEKAASEEANKERIREIYDMFSKIPGGQISVEVKLHGAVGITGIKRKSLKDNFEAAKTGAENLTTAPQAKETPISKSNQGPNK